MAKKVVTTYSCDECGKPIAKADIGWPMATVEVNGKSVTITVSHDGPKSDVAIHADCLRDLLFPPDTSVDDWSGETKIVGDKIAVTARISPLPRSGEAGGVAHVSGGGERPEPVSGGNECPENMEIPPLNWGGLKVFLKRVKEFNYRLRGGK